MTDKTTAATDGQHTPGRIQFRENGDANSYALLDQDGKWLLSLLHNGQPLADTQRANLRRLAACWNGYEGVPIEQIEEHASIGGVAGAFLCIEELRENNRGFHAEIDRLKAKLQEAGRLLYLAHPHISPRALLAPPGATPDTPVADCFLNTQVRKFLEGGAA